MGHDEHGPAYPEPLPDLPYHCPVCRGTADNYLVCNHPACPDGRDWNHPVARARYALEKQVRIAERNQRIARRQVERPVNWFPVASALQLACAVAFILLLLWSNAHPMDHGFDPNSRVTQWMERQIRPDSPPNSCCGKADSYPVDRYVKLPGGDYQVWVENGDAIDYPDGTKRAPWDVNVPLIVPSNKINPEADDLDNPTKHGWLFFRPTNDHEPGTFYCFIRHPQGG